MGTPAGAELKGKFEALAHLVGNTPLLALRFRFDGRERVIYAKFEQANMTGSIKDRMTLCILRKAYAEGQLRPGGTIVEATSGNTGLSFAAMGRVLGYSVTVFMPEWMSRERIDLIRSYGANVILLSRSEGRFLGSIERAERFGASNPDVFLPRQFSNESNIHAHETTTGPEIWLQLESAGLKPDAFVAGVGTGGTIMGVGRFLRTKNADIRVHPVESAESPTLSIGHKVGQHRIQGISDEFVPSIVELRDLDDVIAVSDGDSILMAQKLAAELGLGVGISSGCNFVAALKVQEKLGRDAIVVTVFADDNKKYLSTDLMRPERLQPGYLSPRIEMTGFSTLGRICALCTDSDRFTAAMRW